MNTSSEKNFIESEMKMENNNRENPHLLLRSLIMRLKEEPKPLGEIHEILLKLELAGSALKEDNDSLYGFYQYKIADVYLKSLDLTEVQQRKYITQRENHFKDYNDYLFSSALELLAREEFQVPKQSQNNQAFQNPFSDSEATGSNSLQTFTLVSTCSMGGVVAGSVIPVIGSALGGVCGGIIGYVASLSIGRRVTDPSTVNPIDYVEQAEKEIGLTDFKKLHKRDYTREEFDDSIKICLQNVLPNQLSSEDLKQKALAKTFKIHLSKEIIKRHNDWDE